MVTPSASDNRIKAFAVLMNAVGYVLFVAIVLCGLHVAIGFFASMIGLIAFFFAWAIGSNKLMISSTILFFGIFIAIVITHYAQRIGKVPISPIDNEIEAPEYMMAITNQGSIYNLILKGSIMYFYFSNEACDDTDFLVALRSVMDDTDSYNENMYPVGLYYYVNNSYIFYYDTLKMPADEVHDVLGLLDIRQVPCLVKIQYSMVADIVDSVEEDALRAFFSNIEGADNKKYEIQVHYCCPMFFIAACWNIMPSWRMMPPTQRTTRIILQVFVKAERFACSTKTVEQKKNWLSCLTKLSAATSRTAFELAR
ncbi:MAG: hypothetical protein FWH40_06005 [Coriobacteriia bacterium]|nr:hypothetical protein [Coriobacteriia bacterium]